MPATATPTSTGHRRAAERERESERGIEGGERERGERARARERRERLSDSVGWMDKADG